MSLDNLERLHQWEQLRDNGAYLARGLAETLVQLAETDPDRAQYWQGKERSLMQLATAIESRVNHLIDLELRREL